VDVANTGTKAGDEVVQTYVQHMGSAVSRPIKDLRGYARMNLKPGEKRTVTMPVAVSSLAYWNESTHGWVVEREEVRVLVGASSADIRQQATFNVAP
jgi:beta-glucosidase